MTTQEKREANLIAHLMEQGYTLFASITEGPAISKEVNGQRREITFTRGIFQMMYEGEVIEADDQANSKIAYDDDYRGLYYQLCPNWWLRFAGPHFD